MSIQEAPPSLRSQIAPDMRRDFVNPYIRAVRRARKVTLSPQHTPLAAAIGSTETSSVDMQCTMTANEALAINPHCPIAVSIRDHGIDMSVATHVRFARELQGRTQPAQT